MKISSPHGLDVTPIEGDSALNRASTRWRKEQAKAARRWKSRTKTASPSAVPDFSLLDFLGPVASDFQWIGTQAGAQLLAGSMEDAERLFAHDPETRQTILLVLEEEIARFEELQLRRQGSIGA